LNAPQLAASWRAPARTRRVYPFSAIVGQEEMVQALLLACVDPGIGGVLALGDRGTGKSTAVRALAGLLPPIEAVADCPYHCDPDGDLASCPSCSLLVGLPLCGTIPVPSVDLPLGTTEDRLVGALDLERALADGVKQFEPGLLARANRGFLYVDEINLLEDHLVDLLLDVAASGENLVEREGLSVRHPARFVLVGSGNPEEGDLRPQLLDRFGLSVEVTTPTGLGNRVEVLRRRSDFDRDPVAFLERWAPLERELSARIEAGQACLPHVQTPDEALELAATLCLSLGTDGLRGELTLLRAARALAAFEGAAAVERSHLRRMALPALRHRLRRNPLDEAGAGARVDRAMTEVLGIA
jgi:magnesium chelatase subunit I